MSLQAHTIMSNTKRKSAQNYEHRWGWLVLFTSSATLVCCALPIFLVTLGLGAVSASLFSALPVLVSLAQYKTIIFLVSALLLMVSGWSLFRHNRHCPIDPELAEQCQKAHNVNKLIWLSSVGIWIVGFGAAYLILPISLMLENG